MVQLLEVDGDEVWHRQIYPMISSMLLVVALEAWMVISASVDDGEEGVDDSGRW